MVQLGGPLYGAIALVFVIAANLGTVIIGVYATAVGLRSVPGADRLPWRVNLLIALVPVAVIGVFLPDVFFNNFGTFLAFIGVFFAPLCAIQIVDFLFLRGQRLSVRGLYDRSPQAPYYYWAGFNPAGIAGMAAGFVTYVYLLNPLTYVSRSPYEIVTASLPAAFTGGMIYLLVTLLLVRPVRKGGYA